MNGTVSPFVVGVGVELGSGSRFRVKVGSRFRVKVGLQFRVKVGLRLGGASLVDSFLCTAMSLWVRRRLRFGLEEGEGLSYNHTRQESL